MSKWNRLPRANSKDKFCRDAILPPFIIKSVVSKSFMLTGSQQKQITFTGSGRTTSFHGLHCDKYGNLVADFFEVFTRKKIWAH